MDPSLIPVKPKSKKKDPVVREMSTFKSGVASLSPFLTYENILFFYPKTINFNQYSGTKARKYKPIPLIPVF